MRKGSTEFLILSLLMERSMYGYEISQQLKLRSGGYFEMKEGLLYPALHRMQQNELLATEWRVVEGRRRKYYSLTSKGREAVDDQAAEWRTFIEALHALMRGNELWAK
jgi:PadR family transcriptional regulator PadR